MLKNKLIQLLSLLPLLFACGPVANEDLHLDDFSESLGVKRYYGWKVNSGLEHGRCDMQSILDDCAFPIRAVALNAYRRLLIAPVESTPVPSGFSLVDARTFGTSYFTNMANQWEWQMTTQGTAADLIIVSDETIFNGTPPNATIDLSTVAHIECSWLQSTYTESLSGRAYGCKQVSVKFDVGSFTSWVNQWATSNNQRQAALDSIYRHFLGVGMGLGSTNSTDTLMRRRLSRAQSPITIQNYEKCMLDSANFDDPNYTDPNFGIYVNNCG
jgi:hypothetical protein